MDLAHSCVRNYQRVCLLVEKTPSKYHSLRIIHYCYYSYLSTNLANELGPILSQITSGFLLSVSGFKWCRSCSPRPSCHAGYKHGKDHACGKHGKKPMIFHPKIIHPIFCRLKQIPTKKKNRKTNHDCRWNSCFFPVWISPSRCWNQVPT